MALQSTDLFVVQRQTGGTPLLKATATQLNNYVNKTLDDVTTLGNTTDNDITVGQVTLAGGGNNTQALQKQEIENLIAAVSDLYVDVTGDNMTGDLTLGTDKITLDATAGNATFAGGNQEITAAGSARFGTYVDGTGVYINAPGYIEASRGDGLVGNVWEGKQNLTTTSAISSDGSASFSGRLNVTTLSTAGDLVAQFKNESAGGARQSSFQYTNAGELKLYSISSNPNPSVTIESNDGSASFSGTVSTDNYYTVDRNVTPGTGALYLGFTQGVQKFKVGTDGSASFTGALEAASIDGGTY